MSELDWADRVGERLCDTLKFICDPLPAVLAVPIILLVLAVALVVTLPFAVVYGVYRGADMFIRRPGQ